MRITKLGHACVRIEHDGVVVVIDPGVFTDPGAADGATAVLVTHEHPDHWTADHLRSTDADIWTTDAVADVLAAETPDLTERVRRIAPGQTFDAGVPVTAVGELHAVIHEEIPRIHNSGYLLDVGGRRVYHPGDALTLPGSEVDLLCAPV
ncbi:MAG: MBL fold metallo-hydrolase, partial [Actinobacteria bacterium]|nr:MBL fold metallo-hydrolase [Actinomycetota bacterium]